MTQPRVLSTGSGFLVGRAQAKNSGLLSGTLRFVGIEGVETAEGLSALGHISLMRTPSSGVETISLL